MSLGPGVAGGSRLHPLEEELVGADLAALAGRLPGRYSYTRKLVMVVHSREEYSPLSTLVLIGKTLPGRWRPRWRPDGERVEVDLRAVGDVDVKGHLVAATRKLPLPMTVAGAFSKSGIKADRVHLASADPTEVTVAAGPASHADGNFFSVHVAPSVDILVPLLGRRPPGRDAKVVARQVRTRQRNDFDWFVDQPVREMEPLTRD